MTERDFINDFYCETDVLQDAENIIVTTKVIERISGKVADRIKTIYDAQETKDFIKDSHSPLSLTQWNWADILDRTKRYHIDSFVLRNKITHFLPLNSTDVPDINIYYKKDR